MKLTLSIILIAILTSCSDFHPADDLGDISSMRHPIVVVAKGNGDAGTSVLLRDGNNEFRKKYGECFQGVKIGDTLSGLAVDINQIEK